MDEATFAFPSAHFKIVHCDVTHVTKDTRSLHISAPLHLGLGVLPVCECVGGGGGGAPVATPPFAYPPLFSFAN